MIGLDNVSVRYVIPTGFVVQLFVLRCACIPDSGKYSGKLTQQEEEECVADTPHIPTALVDGKRFSAFRRTTALAAGLNDEEAEELFRRFSDRLNWTDCEWASAIRKEV